MDGWSHRGQVSIEVIWYVVFLITFSSFAFKTAESLKENQRHSRFERHR